MTERRRFLRFDTVIAALCEVAQKRLKTKTRIVNISKEGALLEIDEPLDKGSELKLSMDVPGDNIPIFASAEVAWQKDISGSRSSKKYETGVRFINLENTDKGRLLEYIYTQWLKIINSQKNKEK